MAAPPLESLGRYKLSRVLGKGAMGVVYEGRDPKLNRTVAVKTILVGELDPATAQDYSKRFAREAQAVARLNHPNIVQVYDFGEEGDIAYIVMEYIRGKELKASFDANEKFAIKEAIRLMTELLDALEFAHNEGVVHRDIKPANVMVDSEGHVKLADFGVARISDPDRPGATQVGTMVGTPAYMSPEQVQGHKIDRRTDIFSAGVIFYQFLTGQKPFQGGGAFSVAKRIVQDDPPAPSLIIESLSPEYDRVINRALAKDPAKRYQSAKEFAEDLQRVLKGLPAKPAEDDSTQLFGTEDMPRTEAGPTWAADAQGTEVELEFWRAIKDTDDPEELDLYIENFPQGVYLELAKRKLAALRGTAAPADDAAAENAKREAEARAKQEAEEKAKRDVLEKARRETEARIRREAAEKAKRAAEEKARLEAEAKAKREAEEKAKREALEKARRETEERVRREAAERARRAAEEKARLEAEAKAKREAEEKARREAEEMARREAAEKARKEAEERARIEAEARARREAEERARREAEERARRAAEEKARLEAEARARREAEERARREAEERARLEAEAKVRREAEERARREAEEKARREAAEKARREAEERARLEAEAKARREAEEKARREAEERARAEAEAQARRESIARAMRAAEAKAIRANEIAVRLEASHRARLEAEESVRTESQKKAMREAERKALRAAEIAPRRLAREAALREAQEQVQRESEERVRGVVESLLRQQK